MRSVIGVIIVLLFASSLAFAQDEVVINSIAISLEEASVAVGEEVKFAAEAYDADGNVKDVELVWAVEGDIGTIDADGEFVATTAGTGKVTVSYGGVSAEANVTVTEAEGEGEDEEPDGEPVIATIEIFPSKASIAVGKTVQFEVAVKDAEGNEVEDAEVVWEVSNTEVGTIDDGLFTAVSEGEVVVTATAGEESDEAEVEVTEEGPQLPEGANTITIQRQHPDGKITRFGSTIAENSSITLGGIPYPFNFINGGDLFFPDGSIDDDIVITIKLPKFAKMDEQNRGIIFTIEPDIVSAVSFVVSVDGVEQSYYAFNETEGFKGIVLTLPYKRGLLQKLGIDPTDLGMYYVTDDGLTKEGISEAVVDLEANTITANVAHFSDIAMASKDLPTAVDDTEPVGFILSQNYPNPFNPETIISYRLPESSHVTLIIYSILGQHVKSLVDEARPAGIHSITWDGTNQAGKKVTSGVYIYRIEAGDLTDSRKLLLMK